MTADPSPPSRAYPPPTHLSPSTFPSALCPTCTSHATLQTTLLAAYLPDPATVSQVEYAQALEGEQAYRARLEERYPLVCDRCEPRVTEAMARADYRSRTAVLGGFLRRPPRADPLNRSHDCRPEASAASNLAGLRLIWEAKRLLWFASLGLGLGLPIARAFLLRAFRFAALTPSFALDLAPVLAPTVLRLVPNALASSVNGGHIALATALLTSPVMLLALHFASPLWLFWDPTWKASPNAKSHASRPAQRSERQAWFGLMALVWLSRVTSAALSALTGRQSTGGNLNLLNGGVPSRWWFAALATEVLVRVLVSRQPEDSVDLSDLTATC